MKTGPDRTNYEIWLIDYLDGNLDQTNIDLLMAFLENNPDLKEEFDSLNSINITPAGISFPAKDSLKKSASEMDISQFELLCVADVENDLSEQQKAELNEIIADNPEKRKTLELLGRMKLTAPRVEFRYKYKIRRLTVYQKALRYSAAGLSAAAVIIIALLIFPSRQIVDQPATGLAVNIPVTSPKADTSELKQAGNKVAPNSTLQKPRVSVNRALYKPELTAKQTTLPAQTERGTDNESNITTGEKIKISLVSFNQNVALTNNNIETKLIAINTPDISAPEEPSSRLNGFLARVFREKLFKNETPASGNLKGYEIADAGINGLNKLLGWDMSLQKNKDEKGDIKSVNFNSKLIKFNTPVKKVQIIP